MGLAQEIQKRIRLKEQEVTRLEEEARNLQIQIGAARAYIQGLKDILPKAERGESQVENGFRAGSVPDKVKTLLEKAGRPLHISDIVTGIGKPNSKECRLSVAGTLARYVREGVTFTRPAPNTFGLAEMKTEQTEEALPPGFGR